MGSLDFSSLTSAISMDVVGGALIAMGAVKIVPNATKWAVNKLVTFFG